MLPTMCQLVQTTIRLKFKDARTLVGRATLSYKDNPITQHCVTLKPLHFVSFFPTTHPHYVRNYYITLFYSLVVKIKLLLNTCPVMYKIATCEYNTIEKL